MADVQQVLQDVRDFKSEMSSRFDTIDGVLEDLRGQVASGQVDQAALEQIAQEVKSGRDQLAGMNPEDPSGDDTAETPPPA